MRLALLLALALPLAACADDASIVFVRRVVTREASSAEDNEQMSAAAFRDAQARGVRPAHPRRDRR